jgi:hypothetical protein
MLAVQLACDLMSGQGVGGGAGGGGGGGPHGGGGDGGHFPWCGTGQPAFVCQTTGYTSAVRPPCQSIADGGALFGAAGSHSRR